MKKPWYRLLHWQIILGLLLGVIFGVIAASKGWGDWTSNWVSPFGAIFINLLKLIAVPLVLTSLVTGVASLSDVKKLSRMGGKTIALYIGTTAVAVIIGLGLVNLFKPGKNLPEETRTQLQSSYQNDASTRQTAALDVKERGTLDFLVDIIPNNFLASASNNNNMLQLVFVSLLLGVGLTMTPDKQSRPVLQVFDGLMEAVIQIVHLIMKLAPIGVFGLMANTIVTMAQDDLGQVFDLLGALGSYCLVVVAGLALHCFIVYPLLLRFFTKIPYKRFFSGISSAQLLAFSTSSSGATLPVTMDRCQKRLGVSEEVSSFVLPLGATINMDGTALYQAVASVFIAQALGMDLNFAAQATIVMTAVLASIGTAAVPGAGIIMLVIILEAIHVPSEGIALILGVDRILDMLRTVTNVTGDATVATVIASSENQLELPAEN
ncbi:dicarboxylate/amino acid:cation symporter [Verrucomicrobia bacterium]|jgi:Na+/H+-dicarboxylate symporter|nr:dicarboxylate/amino acid:cation symporter [Verrucomicrobiota bacterium]MDA7559693.1 dicarboxylate/amino acid:cation symporter [bacterium]MDA7665947.1 dicarboxylate/amino acid:cation symporter [Verrucomicrobiota bacterium]MDB4706171.1 dicarboxylate/amino acid:cation symporter [Verrucomicrobiota bacterium]MDB4803549.1 dicarboxylate/amino acid:cation symporter [Verrucomicrobiota bacterium]